MGTLFLGLAVGSGIAFMLIMGFISIEDAVKHPGR